MAGKTVLEARPVRIPHPVIPLRALRRSITHLMRLVTVGILAGVLASPWPTHAASDFVAIRSKSRKFIVFGHSHPPIKESSKSDKKTRSQNFIHLRPQLLAASCERIKEELFRSLHLFNPSQKAKVYLTIVPGKRSADQPVVISSDHFSDGWLYRVRIPSTIETAILRKAIIKTLLLERANRNVGARSTEIPTWLLEGLARYLQRETVSGLLLHPDSHTNINQRKGDPLFQVRKTLTEGSPFTFNELSNPEPGFLTDDGSPKLYRTSAHLFVRRLLQLKNGPICMISFIDRLGQCLNWQTAFLKAFKPHFESLLEVEKWWALVLAQFTGQTNWKTYPAMAAFKKLDKILQPTVKLRPSEDKSPVQTQLTLQKLIGKMDRKVQEAIIKETLTQLVLLEHKSPRELAPIVREYRTVLKSYLNKLGSSGYAAITKVLPYTGITTLKRKTVKQLNRLDQRRAKAKQAWQERSSNLARQSRHSLSTPNDGSAPPSGKQAASAPRR